MALQRKHFILLFIIVLVSINTFIYFPSFFHMTRGDDHYNYLCEMANTHRLSDLLEASYSYTRSRELLIGDKLLFRPLFYVFLAVERWLFSYDFFYWQLTGFILHLIVQWQLFRVLNVFVFSRWSFLFVLLNSVLFMPQEMVTWHNLGGYLLFEALILEPL